MSYVMSNYVDRERFLLAVDCIIFGFDDSGLKLLLIQREMSPAQGGWSLMGGFVQAGESLDEAAIRVLYRLTGLTDIYLEQLHTFGQVNRDPLDRVISVAYFALINVENYAPPPSKQYQAAWFSIDQLPELIFDHGDMVRQARERLKKKAATEPIGFALLPQKFTMPQLQRLYEAILQTDLDRGNFNRRIKALAILQRLDEKERSGSKKGAFLYVFDQSRYQILREKGMQVHFF
jgi:ADP-ribose pyrophosphatase YjhB (NUDIX family)